MRIVALAAQLAQRAPLVRHALEVADDLHARDRRRGPSRRPELPLGAAPGARVGGVRRRARAARPRARARDRRRQAAARLPRSVARGRARLRRSTPVTERTLVDPRGAARRARRDARPRLRARGRGVPPRRCARSPSRCATRPARWSPRSRSRRTRRRSPELARQRRASRRGRGRTSCRPRLAAGARRDGRGADHARRGLRRARARSTTCSPAATTTRPGPVELERSPARRPDAAAGCSTSAAAPAARSAADARARLRRRPASTSRPGCSPSRARSSAPDVQLDARRHAGLPALGAFDLVWCRRRRRQLPADRRELVAAFAGLAPQPRARRRRRVRRRHARARSALCTRR